MSRSTPWLEHFTEKENASLHLLAFPHAGGAAHFFRPLTRHMPHDVALSAVQLPGRWNRSAETAATSIDLLLPELLKGIRPALQQPYVFFGHSLGALLAYSLSRQLFAEAELLPRLLVVSASPLHTDAINQLLQLSDQGLVEELRKKFGGLPEELVAEPDMLKFIIPTIRADLTLAASFQFRPGPLLPCPLLAIGGTQDTTTRPEELYTWRKVTSAKFSLHLFEGGHFYLEKHFADIAQLLTASFQTSA